jgi:hypothetical protein
MPNGRVAHANVQERLVLAHATASKRLADIEVGTALAGGVELPPVVASLDQVSTWTMTGPCNKGLGMPYRRYGGYRISSDLSGSDRYYVELTRQGESSCTTCDFATQSAAQDWIDQDREREDADRQWQVASRRWPWWMHLWWRS